MVTHLARRDGRVYEVLVMAADNSFCSRDYGVFYFSMNILGAGFSTGMERFLA
jgi:hypothetical protein